MQPTYGPDTGQAASAHPNSHCLSGSSLLGVAGDEENKGEGSSPGGHIVTSLSHVDSRAASQYITCAATIYTVYIHLEPRLARTNNLPRRGARNSIFPGYEDDVFIIRRGHAGGCIAVRSFVAVSWHRGAGVCLSFV
ncbi:hypothetical protein MTO96_024115 [Rhipicephalus appendiculatus]